MRILISLLFIGLLLGCSNGVEYNEYAPLPDSWRAHQPIAFHLETQDTITRKNLPVMTRNDAHHESGNLFIIIKMKIPHSDKVIVDTLGYEMATLGGKWLDDGYSVVKESKLQCKEQFTFPARGNYSIKIKQAMYKVGKDNGIQQLRGVAEVGLRVEESEGRWKRKSVQL